MMKWFARFAARATRSQLLMAFFLLCILDAGV
jgi:hypothetical protein